MNKRSIQGVDARMARLIIRIAADAKELNELRVIRRKLITGKLKHPAPAGVKVKLEPHNPGITADTFGDLVPSFGPGR
jgi:hypothetical protein